MTRHPRNQPATASATPHTEGKLVRWARLYDLGTTLRGLGEIYRVLKPGGRLVAVDFGATPGEGIGHLLCVLRLRTGWDHAFNTHNTPRPRRPSVMRGRGL